MRHKLDEDEESFCEEEVNIVFETMYSLFDSAGMIGMLYMKETGRNEIKEILV